MNKSEQNDSSDLLTSGPEPKKIGRPVVADDAKRSTLVRVLTTASEYEELKQAAESDAMSVSTWIRTHSLHKARQSTKAPSNAIRTK